ncbi:putative 2-deoxy-D-gluconate 3-dehydrogenase [Tilletiaria anomala UBC 951]|uniref:Putative 2-deoxy-D-gluconate 3-dehydrogenase n=1 Tax=Tilletiaria anomala (strain ATCC 24038 / CBS 436.72 / UBC 951) TaxID=1037660 RepID=A0A066WFW8_TILAU|nr:putative 2-deoxy-D-gluconate 3-dehydrogenase [Tilletiaria anomala UBC 951]KDN51408.1 putative 2-deoxy-D-gluconate 3-dehydrogenase [Tilletiaria anomala UBC 951]
MSIARASASTEQPTQGAAAVVVGDATLPHCPATPARVSPALFDLAGRHVLLTGGTRGIGQACAVALAQAGARVCLAVRPGTDAAAVLAALPAAQQEQQQQHVTVEADLSDAASVRTVVPRAVAALSGRLDVLVNCAGIQRRAPSEAFPEEYWDEVIAVNLKSAWLLSQAAGKHMLERKLALVAAGKEADWQGGKIINFGSLLTFQGGLTVPAYAAAKGAIGQFTKTLSNEWSKHGIQVNGIAPGYIATDMNERLLADPTRLRQISERIPANRWGQPWDFAGPTVFLASDASRYVCGEMLVVDGGWMGR